MADGTTVDSASNAERQRQVAQAQAAQTQQQQQAQAPATDPAKQAAQRDDTVAAAATANDVQGQRGQKLLDAKPKAPGAPALPGGDPVTPAATRLTADQERTAASLRARFTQKPDAAGFNTYDIKNDKMRALRDATDYASKITDPGQRERFVASIAPQAGAAAGDVKNPGAIEQLKRLGELGTTQSAQTMAREAVRTGFFENTVPFADGKTKVGQALGDIRQRSNDKLAGVAGDVAKAVIPFVDAGNKLVHGDVKGAAKSAGIDAALLLAGGVIGKGVKLAAPLIKDGVKAGLDLLRGSASTAERTVGTEAKVVEQLAKPTVTAPPTAETPPAGRDLLHDPKQTEPFKNQKITDTGIHAQGGLTRAEGEAINGFRDKLNAYNDKFGLNRDLPPTAGSARDAVSSANRGKDGLARLNAEIRRTDETVNKHLTPDDLAGRAKEARGVSTGYDHVKETQDAYLNLKSSVARIDKYLADHPNLPEAQARYLLERRNGHADLARTLENTLGFYE